MGGENNFKVMFVPMLGGIATFDREFATKQEAENALNVIAGYQLFLDKCDLMPGHSTFGMVCELDDDGEWIQIDGDGEEI
jgi:hypothetical protein